MINVVRRSQIVGLTTMDSSTATQYNRVESVWLDDDGKVVYLAGSEGYTSLEQISVVGDDAILTYSQELSEAPENLRRIDRIEVTSPTSGTLGWIEDFLFDWSTGDIAAYILGGTIAEPFGGTAVLFPDDVETIDAEVIVIKEGAKDRLKSEAEGLKGFISEKSQQVKHLVRKISHKLRDSISADDKAETVKNRIKQVSEAQQAVRETQDAIAAIDEGNKRKALRALESATGKLDLVLARQPELGLVPLEAEVDIVSLAPLDLDKVDEIRKQIKQAIKKDELVKARELLDNLANELRITTVNLPLATYPAAMEEAAQLLDSDPNAAKEVLQTALSTLFIEEKQLPIPVIKAQAIINEAASLIQVEGHEEIVQSLLASAQNKLKLAEELGYGERDREYASLDNAIKNIKKQITAGDRAEIAFDNLKEKLGGFFDRISS